MKLLHIWLFLISTLPVLLFASTNDITITIVAGAETHAMINACDCPGDPGGGLAKRAHILKTMEPQDQTMLLDAGGFSGGGIYDSYTEGRASDSIRTILTLKAMGLMGYDAVGIGDDDLQYGGKWLLEQAHLTGNRLVSANCFLKNGKSLAPQYVLIKKAGYTFAVTALTSPEKLFPIDTAIVIHDPIASLKRVWKEMVGKSDFQIILSHLGQELSAALPEIFPECDLVVNGHRKMDTDAVFLSGTVPVMQFGFQGKSLSYARMKVKGSRLNLLKSGWLHIGESVPDDSVVVNALSTPGVVSNPVYDLYIMSQCPYGLEALSEYMEFVKAFPDAEWNIWFIGTVHANASLSSLHGEEEISDEMVWLAIKELYPDTWRTFLEQRSRTFIPTDALIKQMGIDKGKMAAWIKKKGTAELTSHYNRSMRLNIKASPTLLVNNIPFEKQISKSRMAKIQCTSRPNSSKLCDSVPGCFEDTDCRQKGKIGRCLSGECEFRDAVPFSFIAVVADSTLQHPEKMILATTQELFPGAMIETVRAGTKKGAELIEKFMPNALPLYLFDKDVRQAHNFTSIESGIIEKHGMLVFKDGITRINYFHKRDFREGSKVLFIDPFFQKTPEVIAQILADSTLKEHVSFQPVFYNEPSTTRWGTEERFRQEEALRWLVLSGRYPEKFREYLKAYVQKPGSSYWDACCREAKIHTDSLSMLVKADTSALTEHWNKLQELSIREPIVMLLNNRELAIIDHDRELKQILYR